MDVMIVTNRKDNYKDFSKKEPEVSGWSSSDFANEFIDFESKQEQSYRISAIAPNCNQGSNSTQTSFPQRGENSYKTLVDTTQGTLYSDNCQLDVAAVMHDYAAKITLRASIEAKRSIPLTKRPLDPKGIVVRLAGTILIGNTGANSDLWTYDSNKNRVEIYWNKMNLSLLTGAETLQITYLPSTLL
jgi:hypothetical protein